MDPTVMIDADDKPRVSSDLEAFLAAQRVLPNDGLRASGGARAPALAPPAPAPPRKDSFWVAASDDLWSTTIQWYLGAAVAVLLAWLTFSCNGWTPLLSGADLGVHEFGHMITAWAPELLCWLAGSLLQVALPLGLCAYFFWRRDRLAVILTLAWAAESLNNVSVYIYDATRMVLDLFNDDGSGAGHDWHNILGRLNLLGHTDGIAYIVRGLSVAAFAAALGIAAWGLVRARRRA